MWPTDVDLRNRARRGIVVMLVLGAPLIVVGAQIVARPQQVSAALLRSGGRIVGAVTKRPERTVAATAAVLGLVWMGIGCCCLRECRNHQ